MSVDIDIGGNEFDDLEEEEIAVVDAEEVEVLEEEVPQEPEVPKEPPKAPPQAVKKPSPWVKRILVLIVVVVLVIVGIFAFVYFGTKVSDITVSVDPDLEDEVPPRPNDMRVEVLVGATGMASIAGEADLEIVYDGKTVYNSKISIDDGGSGKKYIPFNSFIEGNGYYYITAKYQGVESPPAEYEVDYIVENLDIGIWDSFNNRYIVDVGVVRQGGQLKGQLNLTTYMLDDKGNYVDDIRAELTVVEIKSKDDNTYITQDDDLGQVNESSHTEEYSFIEAGNYTITVELVNTRVNPESDSPYHTISETWGDFLNILPVPVVDTTITPSGVIYTVIFDAGDSFNDGEITLYKWDLNNDGDFEDTGEITTEPSTQADYLLGSSYTVTVNIVGDVIDPDTGELEVGSITVEGP